MSEALLDIQKMIDEAVELRSRVRGSLRDNDFFHVSDAGTCYRKRYFKRLGVEPQVPIVVGALRKMLAGDAGHEMLQRTLDQYGALFAAEGTVSNKNIKGHFDAIVKAPDSPTKVLVEFKTIEKWGMSHIKQDGPKPEHMLQMFTYWHFLRPDYTALDQATLAYVKREDFEVVSFDYLWDDSISDRVREEWKPLTKLWERRELPQCTCNRDYGGNGIKYCRYIAADGESCCSEELLTKEV